MTVLPFPIQQHAALDMAWAQRADGALQAYAGWLFADGYGDPDVPGWLGDAWRNYIVGVRRMKPPLSGVNMAEHWCAFTDLVLAFDPRWQTRVNAALAGLDEEINERRAG